MQFENTALPFVKIVAKYILVMTFAPFLEKRYVPRDFVLRTQFGNLFTRSASLQCSIWWRLMSAIHIIGGARFHTAAIPEAQAKSAAVSGRAADLSVLRPLQKDSVKLSGGTGTAPEAGLMTSKTRVSAEPNRPPALSGVDSDLQTAKPLPQVYAQRETLHSRNARDRAARPATNTASSSFALAGADGPLGMDRINPTSTQISSESSSRLADNTVT